MESLVQGELQAAVWRGGREAWAAVCTVDESEAIFIQEQDARSVPSRHWEWRSVGDPNMCGVLRRDRGVHAFTEGFPGVPEAVLLQSASQAAAAGLAVKQVRFSGRQ